MTNGSNATCGGRAPGDEGAWCQSDDGGCVPGLRCVKNHCVKSRDGSAESPQLGSTGHFCNPEGTRLGIEASGVNRKDIFITIKSGSSGPMQEVQQGDRQGTNELLWLGIDYADLYLMHEGDLGDAGHHPSPFCDYPTTAECERHDTAGIWVAFFSRCQRDLREYRCQQAGGACSRAASTGCARGRRARAASPTGNSSGCR